MLLGLTSPVLLPKLFSSLLWHVPEKQKKIYFTFDDGPVPGITNWVLEILKTYNAKATFFCLGKNVQNNHELFKRIKNEGHGVGNHTFNHLKGWRTKNKDYFHDIDEANKLLNSKYFRPPYGKIKPTQVRVLKKKYKIVLWDVLSKDYDRGLDPQVCLKNVIKHAKPGSIVVFHDSYKAEKNLRAILPQLLEYFTSFDYTFCKLS
jgi:peptidoglycan/xylan/chitin deacetylase (PgdA/CDA1 family)